MPFSRHAAHAGLAALVTLLATACLAVATVLAVPLFLALVAWSTATSLVAMTSDKVHKQPGGEGTRVHARGEPQLSSTEERNTQPLALDVPRLAISLEPVRLALAAVESDLRDAGTTQLPSLLSPVDHGSSGTEGVASATLLQSHAGSSHCTLFTTSSPSSTSPFSSSPSLVGLPSPPTQPQHAQGVEAAPTDAADQQQCGGGASGTAGEAIAPQQLLDGSLLATCRRLGVLGKGAFGIVHLVLVTPKSGPAFEAARKRVPARSAGTQKLFALEVDALKAGLGCPHVVQILDARSTPQYHEILMELLKGGTLENEVHSSPNGCLPETRIKALALDTLRGLAHLHARRVCCRDVKPENVMTRERGGQAVLVDLGMAVKTNAQGVLSANCGMAGSVLQMAPEVMQVTQPAAAGTAAPGKGQGKQRAPLTRITVKSDVYSLGKTLVGCAVRGGVKVDRVRSAPLREFLQRLMAERPEERLSAEEALLHPFLAAQ